MIGKLVTAGFLCAAAALPASAADPVGVPIRAEILNGWQQPDGSRVAAVSLTLAEGWKTYWRAPGDAGIPPMFDWSGSENLAGVGIEWPAPSVFREAGLTTIGYKHALVLPIRIAPLETGAPVTLRATLDLGVCSDICVPQRLELHAILDGTDTRPTPAIAAALAQRPYSAAEAGVTSARCAIRPTAGGIEIEASVQLPDTGGREMVVIETGQPQLWVSEADTSRSANTLTARADVTHVGGGSIALDRSTIRITVLGSNHAVDIEGCTAG